MTLPSTSLSSGSHCDSCSFKFWSLLTICGFTNIISASFPYLSTFSVNSQLLSKLDRSSSSIFCWVVKTCKKMSTFLDVTSCEMIKSDVLTFFPRLLPVTVSDDSSFQNSKLHADNKRYLTFSLELEMLSS